MESLWWRDGEGLLLASKKSLQNWLHWSRCVDFTVLCSCQPLEALQVQRTFLFCPVFREFKYLGVLFTSDERMDRWFRWLFAVLLSLHSGCIISQIIWLFWHIHIRVRPQKVFRKGRKSWDVTGWPLYLSYRSKGIISRWSLPHAEFNRTLVKACFCSSNAMPSKSDKTTTLVANANLFANSH